jgi:TonB family protein
MKRNIVASLIALASLAAQAQTPEAYRVTQLRGEKPVYCTRGRVSGDACVLHALRVENLSNDTLECSARVSYDGVNGEGASSALTRNVVSPKQTREVLRDRARFDVPITDAAVDCTARPPRPPLDTPSECRLKIVEARPLDEFYPADSRRLEEEGPIVASFTLPEAEGLPSDVKVAGSSLHDRLDDAAVEYLKTVKFATPCPGRRYELRVVFSFGG